MKNSYDEIRPVMSVIDVRNLVRNKSLIQVKGWKKPVSASFIGVMPEHTIKKYVDEERMHVVARQEYGSAPDIERIGGKTITNWQNFLPEPISGIKPAPPKGRERNSETGHIKDAEPYINTMPRIKEGSKNPPPPLMKASEAINEFGKAAAKLGDQSAIKADIKESYEEKPSLWQRIINWLNR